MRDLLTIVKLATKKIKAKYTKIDSEVLTDLEIKDIELIILETYNSQPILWRAFNNIKFFEKMVSLDMQYNFIGGVQA